MHSRADRERVVEHAHDDNHHREERDHAGKSAEPTTWTIGVVRSDEIHEQKGADVDQHPQHVGDLGLCEEQQLLTRRTGVRDEGGGAAEGRPLAVVVHRKLANSCSSPIAEHERAWLFHTTPALHRGPIVGDDRSHVADEIVPNRIPRLGRIGVQRVPERDERTRLLLASRRVSE
jgi:hypothetical protein